MGKVYKVGLIGCGHIAETYFRAHKYFNNFKIIKCADINKLAAQKCAKTYLISFCTFLSCDFVNVSTFNYLKVIEIFMCPKISFSYMATAN